MGLRKTSKLRVITWQELDTMIEALAEDIMSTEIVTTIEVQSYSAAIPAYMLAARLGAVVGRGDPFDRHLTFDIFNDSNPRACLFMLDYEDVAFKMDRPQYILEEIFVELDTQKSDIIFPWMNK